MNIVLTLSEATIERETSHVNFVGSDPQSCVGSLLCQLVVFIPDVLPAVNSAVSESRHLTTTSSPPPPLSPPPARLTTKYSAKIAESLSFNLLFQVGINPGLYAAFKQHHYAGPGNHFCEYHVGVLCSQSVWTVMSLINGIIP